MKVPLYSLEKMFAISKQDYSLDDFEDARNPFEILYGSTIEKMEIDKSTRTELTVTFRRPDLITDWGYTSDKCQIVFLAERSCCNDVWFESVTTDVTGMVLHSEAKFQNNIPAKEMKGTQDYEDVLCWTIATTNGYIDIDVRNSNNGYYSGSVGLYSIKIGI